MITDIETFIDGAIAYQYKASPNFKGFIQGLGLDAQHLADEIEKVKWERFLGKAKGVQLDILGDILGIRREVVDLNELVYFGFEPDPTALSFTSLDNPRLGGRYRAAAEAPSQFRLLNDTEYRAVLQAKVAINASNCTIPEVIKVARGLFLALIPNGGVIPLSVSENYDAKFTLYVGADIDDWIKALILSQDLIPRPAGVDITLDYLKPNRTLTVGADATNFAYGFDAFGYGAIDNDAIMNGFIRRIAVYTDGGGAFAIRGSSLIVPMTESVVISFPDINNAQMITNDRGADGFYDASYIDSSILPYLQSNVGNDIPVEITRLEPFVPDRKLLVGTDNITFGYNSSKNIGSISYSFLNGVSVIQFEAYQNGNIHLSGKDLLKFSNYNFIEIEFSNSELQNLNLIWNSITTNIYSEANREDVLEYFKANVGKQIDFKIVDRRV